MSFLDDYAAYAEPLEVPDIFHTWCAMSALAAAAQRKIWIDMGLFVVTPNLYVILCSPPGKCGKDTAMNIVREIVSKFETIKTKSDSITKERIFDDMVEGTQPYHFPEKGEHLMHSSLTLFATEMSLLIKKGDKDFVSALNALFNTLTVFKHSTKHSGESVIINPYLNILGGTTPDWISNNIQEDVIEGGLSARTILVNMDTPKPPNPFPEVTPTGKKAYERIIIRIDRIIQLGGCFVMPPDVRGVYADWYIRHMTAPPRSEKMAGFHYRKRIHLLKTMMLMSLAVKDELILTIDDFKRALALLDLTEPCIEAAFAGVGRNVLGAIAQTILRIIKTRGEIRMEELIASTFHLVKVDELKEILQSLQGAGSIGLVVDAAKGHTYVKYLKG